ncbi:MAG TPA: SDR family oxidoreductase [Gaiellaceae bacterium]|nr:SDR family oxidoreductase [Gaiellaceae bacterium]
MTTTTAGRLAGKTAIVTGAGSGIGRAAALRFAAEGARVAAVDLDGAKADETRAAAGAGALALTVDVTDAEAVQAAVAQVTEAFGGVDVYFNNAGVPQAAKPFAETSREEWDRIIAVNLTALFTGVQAVAPVMREQGGGSVVVTSSIAATRPRPGIATYVASKAGVNGLVRALALELAPDRVRVNAIAPVAVRTPMLAQFAFADSEQATIERVEQTIPLGRLVEPEDIAAAALYLASDEARCVTGIILNVDGGRDL